jgi:carboxypeptidase Taq
MSTTNQRAYDELLAHLRQMALIASSQELLAWDELTYLPDEGTEHRARQLAHLAGLHHALATDRRLDDWLAALDGSPLVADPHSATILAAGCAAAANVREARRQHARLANLPRSLVEELARVTTVAQHEWAVARQHSDFGRLVPWLEQIVKLKREEARCLLAPLSPRGRGVGGEGAEPPNLYDGLLAEYEPGLRTSEVEALFASLRQSLSELLPRIVELQARKPPSREAMLTGEFPESLQRPFFMHVARDMGFDFARGRLDTAVHPFTTHLGPHDCRLAIRYDERNLGSALFALLHELGHGLYDQGLPAEHFGTPAGEAISLGVHESQARLWENAVGRSLGFWRFCLPRIQSAFPGQLAGAPADEVWREVNRVQPGTCRVGADEATYNLHIVLRFELEQQLLFGELAVADLPAAWNRRAGELLGVVPANDLEGVLQDGHWAAGQFGYFPTYTIGNVLAAQLAAQVCHDLGNLDEQFSLGDFAPLRTWLHERIYRHGKRFTTLELAHRQLGGGLDTGPLVAALTQRHEQLWLDY